MSVDYIAFRSTRKPTIVIVFGISDACAGKPLQVIVANAATIVGFDIKALDVLGTWVRSQFSNRSNDVLRYLLLILSALNHARC
jgi:hypothetical protein